MPEKPPQKVELQLPQPQVDLQPIHDRLSTLEQVLPDLRERAARTEAQVEQLAAHNPASETALQLATEARALAESALKKAEKLSKEAAAVPAKPLPEIPPKPAPQDPDPDPEHQPEPVNLEPPRPWWHRFK